MHHYVLWIPPFNQATITICGCNASLCRPLIVHFGRTLLADLVVRHVDGAGVAVIVSLAQIQNMSYSFFKYIEFYIYFFLPAVQ